MVTKFLDKCAWTDLKHFWAGTCASIMPKHWQNWWVFLCPFDEIAVQTDVLVLHRTIGGRQCSLKVRKFEKEIVVSPILPKSQQFFPLISALASKKWSNQNNKCTLLKVALNPKILENFYINIPYHYPEQKI